MKYSEHLNNTDKAELAHCQRLISEWRLTQRRIRCRIYQRAKRAQERNEK